MKSLSTTFIYFLITFLCFSSNNLLAQGDLDEIVISPPSDKGEIPVPPSIPDATIEWTDTEFDFGEIDQGEKVSHVYTFTNTSEEMLILTNAKGSCGCTVPEWPKDPIAPGETASIVVQFDSNGKRNKQNKKVTITANTNPAQSFLFLKGEVLAPEPGQDIAEFKAEMPEEPSPDCFMIYPNPTAEILQIDMSKNIGKVAIISIHSKAGQLMAKRNFEEVESNVIFNVSHYPPGTYIASVQIQGSRGETKCFVVVGN